MVEWRLPWWTMTLNIKDPEAHELAQRLAEETGESMTAAVKEALRERLERVRRSRKRDALLADIHAISARAAAALQGPPVDHAEMLYDENGLPK
jgi:antitoxin VapB